MERGSRLCGQHIALNEPLRTEKLQSEVCGRPLRLRTSKTPVPTPPHEAYEPRPGFANPARLAEPLANQSGRRELRRIGFYCPCNNSTDPLHFAQIYLYLCVLYCILYSVCNISFYIDAYSCHVIILDEQKRLFCEAFTKTFANHF